MVDDPKNDKHSEIALAVQYDDVIHSGYSHYDCLVNVRFDVFVLDAANADRMIETMKEHYRYMMYEAKALVEVVVVHVDDF